MRTAYSYIFAHSVLYRTWKQHLADCKYSAALVLVAFSVLAKQNIALGATNPNELQPSPEKRGPDKRPETEKIIGAGLPTEEVIDKIIQILNKESVEESLSRLDEIKMYIWPGWVLTMGEREDLSSILKTPLKTSVGQRDVVIIIANRRFLKLSHELALLPNEKAEDSVSREITSALSQYKILFDSYMQKHAETFQHNLNKFPSKSLGFVHTTADGVPTLLAMRFKVLALTLLAGNLQLQQTQPAISKVLETAIAQRDMFYTKNAFYQRDAALMLCEGSLYNRQILATAVLGTYITSDMAGQLLKDLGYKLKSDRLTRYNAVCTTHDLYPVEKRVPVDYSKGELTVRYVGPMDDTAFDNIVRAVAEARKQNAQSENAD